MITAETLTQARNTELIPSIFDGVEPLEFQTINIVDCNSVVKDNLTCVGAQLPITASAKTTYRSYEQAGYRKATPDDFKDRNACPLAWNENDQAYIDGDIVIMVIEKKKKLGYEYGAYLRSNLPLMNKEQREEVMKRVTLTPAQAERVAAVKATEEQGSAKADLKNQGYSLSKK